MVAGFRARDCFYFLKMSEKQAIMLSFISGNMQAAQYRTWPFGYGCDEDN